MDHRRPVPNPYITAIINPTSEEIARGLQNKVKELALERRREEQQEQVAKLQEKLDAAAAEGDVTQVITRPPPSSGKPAESAPAWAEMPTSRETPAAKAADKSKEEAAKVEGREAAKVEGEAAKVEGREVALTSRETPTAKAAAKVAPTPREMPVAKTAVARAKVAKAKKASAEAKGMILLAACGAGAIVIAGAVGIKVLLSDPGKDAKKDERMSSAVKSIDTGDRSTGPPGEKVVASEVPGVAPATAATPPATAKTATKPRKAAAAPQGAAGEKREVAPPTFEAGVGTSVVPPAGVQPKTVPPAAKTVVPPKSEYGSFFKDE
jgi:hypothetical protein